MRPFAKMVVTTFEGPSLSTHATAIFEIKTWDEKPYLEIEGGSKLTRAAVTRSGSRDLNGLRGEGRYVATHADYPNVPFTLDYSID